MTVAVRRSYVDVAGAQVHLRMAEPTRGEAARPPLLCLHMSPASSVVYERFAAHMGVTRQVVAPDTPGFGASDPPTEEPEIADYARTMAGLLEELGVAGPVDLLGYHTGSLIAVELAAQRPDLVRRVVAVSLPVFDRADLDRFLVLYDTRSLFDADGERLLEKWRWFVDFYGAAGPAGRNTVAEAGRIFTARLSGGERHWWGHHAAFRYDLVARLAQVHAPVLVLNPDDDLATQTPRVTSYLRSGRVIDVPQWSHGFLDHDTAAAVALVSGLLDAEDPGAAASSDAWSTA